MTHHSLLLMLALLVSYSATAAVPSGYYNNAKGKSDQALMTALHKIIKGHTKRSYDQLKTDFKTTDCNGNIIIDRYSNSQFTYGTDFCGNYNGVGDCYNREHSIPNSWWGGSSSDTAYTDLHHLFPVDGFVNSQRGNNPFGNCRNGVTYGTGKLGTCSFSGYTGTVFEVADEYKGDFARVYFYFATRYMMRMSDYTSGTGADVFTASSYLGLKTWAINQLLEWHRNDPVSTLETTRNDNVYTLQRNRNPFVDYPELVEYIWGNMKGHTWNAGGTVTPKLTSPVNGSTVNVGTNTGNGVTKTITVKGSDLTKALTVTVSGSGFSVTPMSITATAANNGTTVTVTYNGTSTSATGTLTVSSDEVSSTVNLTASYSTGGGNTGEETVETWEGCTTGGYWTQVVQGHAFSWNFSNAGIYADPNKNDAQSCRFGRDANSFISMNEDMDGASKVTFYAANWSGDATSTLQLQYSTDGGSTWTAAGSCSLSSTWKQYSFDVNVTGNVRFKIAQTAGVRLNIDDIAITSNGGAEPPVTNPQITSPVNGSTVNVGTISATGSSVSKSITIRGSELTQSLRLSVSGTGFRVSPSTVSATAALNGTNVIITYSSTVAGDATGVLTISSSEVNVTVNLTASKVGAPSLAITSLDAIEAVQDGESTIVQGTVSSENNTTAITLSVEGNFELSLNQYTWARSLTLDPDGEVFYVRLASTSTVGDYYGSITAEAGNASAFADVEGYVSAPSVLLGDVDMDGNIGISDVSDLVDYVLGSVLEVFSAAAADVDQNGNIGISDITALIDLILNPSRSLAMMKWNAVPLDGVIEINNPGGEKLEVYNLDAEVIAVINTPGKRNLSVPAGVYLISGNDKSRKVVIK